MRNLKKLISLLLVVAMIASLCVGMMATASAADEEVSSYPIPAKVMTGIGVITGYEDGTYRYQEPVKRSEAATIIARLMLGFPMANSLNETAVQFTDVPKWASGYIAYLAKVGVVNGKSETTFDPNGNVTAIEFAKMLLCALGYGKQGEYVGAGWDIATLVDANALGIFNGAVTAADLTKAATREECILYAYNALTKYTVNYNNTLNTYQAANDTQLNKTNYKRLGDKFNVKAYYPWDGVHDEYGRPVTVYDYNRIYQTVIVEEPAISENNGVNSDMIYANYGKDVAGALKGEEYDVWVDGVLYKSAGAFSKIYNRDLNVNTLQFPVYELDKNGDYVYDRVHELNADGSYALDSNGNYVYKKDVNGNYIMEKKQILLSDVGATIEVYGSGVDDFVNRDYIRGDYTSNSTVYEGGTVTFVIYYEKGGMISGVKTDKNGDTVYTLDNGKQIVNNELKGVRGDYMIYTEGNKAVYGTRTAAAEPIGVKIAEKLTGSLTAYRPLTNSFVINGKSYGISHSNKDEILTKLIDRTTGSVISGVYTFMLDSYGNILDIDMVDELFGDYLYVTNVTAKTISGDRFTAMNGGLMIDVVYTDGTGTGALLFAPTLDVTNNRYYANVLGKKVYLDQPSATIKTEAESYLKTAGAVNGYGWYAYALDRNGYVSLYELDGNYETAAAYTYNSYSPTVTLDVTYKYLNGYTNVPKTFIADSTTKQVIIDSKGHVSTRTGYTRFQAVTGYALYTYARVGYTFDTIYIYMADVATTVVDAYAYLMYQADARAYEGDYVFLTTDGETKTVTIDYTMIPAGGMNPGSFYDLSYFSGRLINVAVADISKLSTYHWDNAYDEEGNVIKDENGQAIRVNGALYPWYNAAEASHSLYTNFVPAGYTTISRSESTYFVMSNQDYDYNGPNQTMRTYTYDEDFYVNNNLSSMYVMSPSCKIVDTTGQNLKTLTDGMAVICQLNNNGTAEIIWIMYTPAE